MGVSRINPLLFALVVIIIIIINVLVKFNNNIVAGTEIPRYRPDDRAGVCRLVASRMGDRVEWWEGETMDICFGDRTIGRPTRLFTVCKKKKKYNTSPLTRTSIILVRRTPCKRRTRTLCETKIIMTHSDRVGGKKLRQSVRGKRKSKLFRFENAARVFALAFTLVKEKTRVKNTIRTWPFPKRNETPVNLTSRSYPRYFQYAYILDY